MFTAQQESLPQGKADFLLVTTPPLNDAEFITTQEGFEMFDTEESYPFSLITRAIHNLNPFSTLKIVQLKTNRDSLLDAQDIFSQGMALGRSYEIMGNYLILAQSSLDVTQSALKTLEAFNDDTQKSNFEKLSLYCDATLIFCAGFLLEATRRFHVVLGGGIEMATTLLIADRLREDLLMRIKSENLSYATTLWTLKELESKQILEQLSYQPNTLYTILDVKAAEIQKLKKYTTTTLTDKAGAGAALAYGVTNGLTDEVVLNEMELIIYMA